ncbi:MAG: hypothetical protein LBR68_02885, partial [Lachnoclostridium sp.]|nr:hypothetical protein [Lachnoclostridium sp.]
MRVTGSIMSNNAMLHMAKSKVSYNKYFQQYMTNTKILKASDDPIIAIRSLKYRARISELEQYTDKNIPDAKSWIELTNTALDNVNTILTNMNEYCDQAANGPLETEDREKIKNQLLEYVKNIFEDNANQKNADRYLFTGYRTDIPLLFDSESTNTTYNITENFTPDDVFSYTYAYGGAEYDNPNTTAPEYAQNLPESKKTHIMTLSYDNTDINYDAGGDIVSPTVTFIDKNGTEQTVNVKTIPIAQAVPYNQCYDPNSDTEGYGAYYIPETGELAFRDDIYANISEASSITVNYSKTNFKENEIRPEHYFDCTATNNLTGTVSNYREPEKQQINYQINFSQTLTVNTLACDAFDISIKRAIDKVVYIMDEIEVAEAALAKVEKDIADGVGDQLGLAQLKEQ